MKRLQDFRPGDTFELVRTETFLPKDNIFILRLGRSAQAAGR